MNWGIKIAILYLAFVSMILTLVFKTMHQKVDLVASDYYDQEIKFQEKINATGNAQQLNVSIDFAAKNQTLQLIYPKDFVGKTITGEINLYRPSDASLDFKTSIAINTSGEQIIANEKFRKGLYKMQISWKMDNKDYYLEESVFMN